jgi:hypothetical protein
VNFLNISVSGNAGVSRDDFLGASVEGGAHDGAFRRPFGQHGKRREAGRRGSRE